MLHVTPIGLYGLWKPQFIHVFSAPNGPQWQGLFCWISARFGTTFKLPPWIDTYHFFLIGKKILPGCSKTQIDRQTFFGYVWYVYIERVYRIHVFCNTLHVIMLWIKYLHVLFFCGVYIYIMYVCKPMCLHTSNYDMYTYYISFFITSGCFNWSTSFHLKKLTYPRRCHRIPTKTWKRKGLGSFQGSITSTMVEKRVKRRVFL